MFFERTKRKRLNSDAEKARKLLSPRKTFSVLLLVMLLSIAVAGTVIPVHGASTWYVDPSGTNDGFHGTGTGTGALKTLQYAIDDSRVVVGDMIQVATGTYTENLVINKGITLKSSGGAGSTTINPAVTSDLLIDIKANYVTVDGFTVSGHTGGDKPFGQGAAIFVRGVDHCTIKNNILTGNTGESDIGLFGGCNDMPGVYPDYNTVYNNVIYGGGKGYGIKVKGSHNTIDSNTLYNLDEAIALWSLEPPGENTSPDYNTISNNVISAGSKLNKGISIKTGHHTTVTGNTITSAVWCGIFVYSDSKMKTEGDFDIRPAYCTISGNTITGGEAGIVLTEGANHFTISGNTISGTSVAGILGSVSRWPEDWTASPSSYLQGAPQAYLQITDHTISGNTISNCGHGVAMQYGDRNTLTGNTYVFSFFVLVSRG